MNKQELQKRLEELRQTEQLMSAELNANIGAQREIMYWLELEESLEEASNAA